MLNQTGKVIWREVKVNMAVIQAAIRAFAQAETWFNPESAVRYFET